VDETTGSKEKLYAKGLYSIALCAVDEYQQRSEPVTLGAIKMGMFAKSFT